MKKKIFLYKYLQDFFIIVKTYTPDKGFYVTILESFCYLWEPVLPCAFLKAGLFLESILNQLIVPFTYFWVSLYVFPFMLI